LTLTHIPRPGPIPEVPGGDKTLHFTGYFIAGLLLQRCFSFRWQLAFAVALIALIGLGAVDEATQAFVNRTPSIRDWYADAAGVVCSSVAGSVAVKLCNAMSEKNLC
jgi:VanZ family protein